MSGLAINAVEIELDGRAWTPTDQRLLAVRVVSRLARPTRCELTLGGGPGWPAGWRLGSALAVRVDGDPEPLFDGELTGVEVLRGADAATARVRAHDRLHRLGRRQRPQVFTDVTMADLAGALAADLGLTVRAEESGARVERIIQHHQSDLDILVEMAAAAGLHPVVRGRMLDLVTLAGRGDPVKLRCGESLWEAAVEASVDQVAGRVTAVGWQPGRAAALAGEAGAARSGLDVAATPAPAAAGADDPVRLVEGAVGSDEAAAGLAQATLDTRVAGSVVLRGIAAGTAALWPGARVEVDGLDDTVDGGYVLTAVTHTVDGNGYLSSVSTEPPAPPRPAALPAVTLGVVTAVDDPDGLGRVRVTLPAFGEVDAGWLAVLTPGAGADRGLVIRPEVDDTVLVALAQQSPAAGVVLGGLYGPGSPPDASPRRWTLRTGQGQSIVVDDEHDRVRVENRGGSYVDLSPGEVRLHAAADLVLDAAGHAVTIRAASVDFQHQPIPLSG